MTTKTITLDQAASIISEEGSLQLQLHLMKAGYRVMHYYGERILAHKSTISEFCMEGLYCCEGCQRDRLVDLLVGLDSGHFHIYDVPMSEADSYRDRDQPIKSWDAWQAEDDEILGGAC